MHTVLFTKHLLWITALLLVYGCSILQPQGGQQTIQDQLTSLKHWQVRGKMSVTTPEDSVTGYMDWKQKHDKYDLYIAGPLGQGSTRIKGNKNKAELTLPGWKSPQSAVSAESLMKQHLGWSFPISDVQFWVKGQPSPNASFTAIYDEHGLLKTLTQYGWTIEYKRFSPQKNYWLPGLVKVQGRDLRFVFSIKEWTLYD